MTHICPNNTENGTSDNDDEDKDASSSSDEDMMTS